MGTAQEPWSDKTSAGALRLTIPKMESSQVSAATNDVNSLRGLGTVKISAAEAAGEERASEARQEAETELSLVEKIQKFLESSTIEGVRMAGKDSKLILNGVIYEQGEAVAPYLGLRLNRITTSRIIFQDEKGNYYPLNY